MRSAALTLALGVALTACAAVRSAPAPDPPGAAAARAEVEDLLAAQVHEVSRFDGVLAHPDRCVPLCEHLDAICVIAGRICELADVHPEPMNAAACDRASARCAETAERLPADCPCVR